MTKTIADDQRLCARAISAYYRTAAQEGIVPDTPAGGGDVVEHAGKLYVVLTASHRTIAVYRVHNAGPLRRMKRWPREVADRP